MEILVPIAIAAIGIGAVVFLLRRPTVVRPPGATPSDVAPTIGPSQPPGTIILRARTTLKTSSVTLDKTNLGAKQLFDLLARGKTPEELTQKLLHLVPNGDTDAPPEARLSFPGSTILLMTGESLSNNSELDPTSADFKTTFASDADGGEVASWYQDWLTTHGWQPDTAGSGDSGLAHEFSRGAEHFRLTLADPAALRAVIAVPIPDSAKTIYEVEYKNSTEAPQV